MDNSCIQFYTSGMEYVNCIYTAPNATKGWIGNMRVVGALKV